MQLQLFEEKPYEIINRVFMGEWKYLIKSNRKEVLTNTLDETFILKAIGIK